jgi:hypothetical protein
MQQRTASSAGRLAALQVYESAYAIARPQIQAGKIKMLAATNTARASAIPDIPTVAEAGYSALTMDGVVGLFGPPTVPTALRERLAADIKEILDGDAIVKDRLILTAQIPNPGGPSEFAKLIRSSARCWPRRRRGWASTNACRRVSALFHSGRDVCGPHLYDRWLFRQVVGEAAVADRAVMVEPAVRTHHTDRIERHVAQAFDMEFHAGRERLVGVRAAKHELGHGSPLSASAPLTPAAEFRSSAASRRA